MSNQTIDGVLVPRDLALRILECISYEEADELRALLDAKSVRCHGCMAEGVSPDHFDSAGKCKAAQHQGEPVAWVEIAGDGSFWPDSYTTENMSNTSGYIPLYAERPAPAAVVLPERMLIPDTCCPERINAQGWNACLDEVKRLNTQ